MADLIQSLRVKKILNSLFQPPRNQQPMDEIPRPLDPPDNPLARLSTRPLTPEMDAYKAYLRDEPNKENYKGNAFSKILASVAGFAEGMNKGASSGIGLSKSLIDRPYNEARSKWESKGGRLKELADLEDKGLTSDQKLQVQLEDFRLKNLKETHDWLKDQYGMKLTDAQIRNLDDQVKNRGLEIVDDKTTGQKMVVNKSNPNFTPVNLGKFAESLGEADTREKGMFRYKEGIQQGNRINLQNDAQSHAIFMEGLRTSNDKDLARLRQELQNANPSAAESNSGFEGATNEVLQQYPELKNRLFEVSPDGKTVKLRVDKNGNPLNMDAYSMFTNAVKTIQAKKLGQPAPIGVSVPRSNMPNVSLPTTPAPQINPNLMNSSAPNSNPNSDAIALQELKKIGVENPTSEMIQEAKKDLGLQ